MSPTARTAAALALIAVAAVFVPWWWCALLGLALAGALLADAIVARRPVEVTRSLQPILARGVSVPFNLVAGPAAGRVRLRQAAPPDLLLAAKEGEREVKTTVTARRRGRHVLPAPAARVVGPLGLAAWYRRPGDEMQVLVYPDLPAARRLATAVRRGRFRMEGEARGPLGLGTDFESVRDYEPDDDVRQVNWRTTQRLGRPMSNQYRLETDRDVICLVDCGRLMAAPLRDRTRLDATIDAAVAVASVADAVSDRCGALAFDAEVRRQVAPRRSGGRAVVQALFDLEPVGVDSDYAAAFASVGAAKRAWVLLLTDLLEETAARPLLDALPSLARRHAVAVASAVDLDLEDLLVEPPRERSDVYRTAVALDVRGSRRGVAAELRRRGVDVIEAPAEQLATACVRAYLRSKARARV